MSVRKCTERSSLTLGDPSQWGQEYPESRTSTPTGNITIYWKVDEGAGFIEYAIAAVTDAWVAVGTRPESVSNVGTTPAGLPASETQGESEGQPEAEGEAEGQPEAEGEPEGEAEGQPEGEAEGEVESESGSSSQVCTNFPGSEDSTTCPRPSTGAALTVIKVLPAVEPEAENEPEGESETEPAAEAETVAEPSSNRRLLANRRLLDGHGEPEPEAEAEGQPEADGYVHKDGGDALRIPGETPCNALIVSGSAHPMVNIDIVVGAAIGNTFRVYDAFTPSRSRPLPDAVFGGQDDILDAVGKETTDGDGNPLTLIRFRKPLVSQDAAADYCIVRDVRYRMLYAYGQSSPRGAVFHAPASALETGTGKNTGFYRPDALLFHGGGISSGRYDTRGSFAGIDFFPNTGACAPSTLAPTSTGSTFDCQLELAMGYTLHWTADVNAGTVRMAAQAPTTAGWVALGFPTNGAAMAGALVVLGSPDNIKTYRLPGYTPPGAGWPEEAIEGLNPSSLALTRTPTHTIIEFERREVPGVFELAGEQPLIAAYNLASHVHTNIHSSGTNQGFFWSAAGEGEPDACPPRSPNWSLYVAHGALMCAAWGVFIPVGVVIAGTLKDKDPLWFQCHRGINLAGLVVAAAAWILALAKFGPLISGGSGDGLASAHTVIGMIVMILGILQPVNAFFRPHKGEKNRWIFNWVHWTSGRVAWFGGLLNVFIGIFLFRERDGRCSPNWPIYVYAAWLFVYACIWAGLEIRKAKGGRVDAEEKPAKLEG